MGNFFPRRLPEPGVNEHKVWVGKEATCQNGSGKKNNKNTEDNEIQPVSDHKVVTLRTYRTILIKILKLLQIKIIINLI